MRGWNILGGMAVVFGAALAVAASSARAQTDEVTFTKDIAPILQRSCQSCHRPDSIAPMSLLTYDEVRPYARAIKERTLLRHRRGGMPPWFIEKEIGIQRFKDDISLTDGEIARIARWVDAGAPRGNPADLPPARVFSDNASWQIGTPDLIVTSPAVEMKAVSPDYWGALAAVPTGLSEDRYVAAMEMKEVNDSRNKPGRATVGGLFVFHHAVLNVSGPAGRQGGGAWPVHEVGRNADVFDTQAGKLLAAGSTVSFPSVHLHANGKDTNAKLQIGFKFHPVGYKPQIQSTLISIGTDDIDIPGGASGISQSAYMTLSQPLKLTVFEPHMHATGVRMCLEAINGSQVETLNCSGYDHNWVKTYAYREDAAPLLPRGTILKVTGYFDNTPGNKNVVDPRNWSGLGHRSIDNMLVMIAQGVNLTEEQFAREVANRRTVLNLIEGQTAPGCPLCAFARIPGRPGIAWWARRRSRREATVSRTVVLLVALAAALAQQPATGLNIAPVYEGWEQNADGSFDLIFGYFNRNWNEWIDVPAGVANTIEPGVPDQGQPTHFLPRRNQFVFRVRVPRDFGNRELVWTLTSNGKTEKAYGSLKPDYVVNATVMAANFGAGGQTGTVPDLVGNVGPVLKIEGERTRRVKVGEPVALIALATDDGKPRTRPMQAQIGANRTVPNSATGLRLVWLKYRGSGDVTFDPPQFSAWQDTRDGANSPWAPGWRTPPIPADNKWETRATFKTPGEYVLRCVAHDGALTATENVTVVVTR